MRHTTTMWQRIKEFPPVIASVVAVLAAVIGVVTWISGYFATRQYVDHVHCLTLTNNTLNSRQIDQTLALQQQQALDAKIKYLRRQKKRAKQNETSIGLTRFEEESLEQNEKDYKEYGKAFAAAQKEANRLLSILKSGDLFDGQECKAAQEVEVSR